MKSRAFRIVLSLLAMSSCFFAMSACNTFEGAGEDIERTGEHMQGD